VPRTSDIILGGRLMVMLKGDNGAGKTVTAASFPGPIKFFMFDGSKLDVVKMFFPHRRTSNTISTALGDRGSVLLTVLSST
jgi:hypothetical protein